MYAHFLQEGNLWIPDKPLQTLWGGRQPAIQMCRLGAAPHTPPRILCLGSLLGGGGDSPRNTALVPSGGAGFKLHPVWRQRTLTAPHPTRLPNSPSYGSSSPYHPSKVSQYAHGVLQDAVGSGELPALPPQQDPSRRSPLERMGGCPTSAEPLTPKQDISQTRSASSAPTACSPPTSYSPPGSVSTPAPG